MAPQASDDSKASSGIPQNLAAKDPEKGAPDPKPSSSPGDNKKDEDSKKKKKWCKRLGCFTMATVTSGTRHLLFCLLLATWVVSFCYFTGALRFSASPLDDLDPFTEYGAVLASVLVLVRVIAFLALPQTLFNLVGLTAFNAFPERPALKGSPLLAPFVCVRVVTRGLYPRLVKETVSKNAETLARVGLENYVVQVVTDTAINLSCKLKSQISRSVVLICRI